VWDGGCGLGSQSGYKTMTQSPHMPSAALTLQELPAPPHLSPRPSLISLDRLHSQRRIFHDYSLLAPRHVAIILPLSFVSHLILMTESILVILLLGALDGKEEAEEN
jgi:hypothetical protein